MLACSNCGEEISPKWIVCPICSHPAGVRSAPVPAEDSDPIFSFAEILCIKCKKKIGPDTQICPHCHVPIIRRYCSGCQRLIPDHVNLCPYCHAEPTVKKGLGRAVKVALFFFLPAFLFLAYVVFHRTETRVQRTAAPELTSEEPWIRDPVPSEADLPQRDPASPELLPDPRIPSAISPVDVSALKPSRIVTNTVERIASPQAKPKREEPHAAPDFAARGARLKQGRQLKELGLRLIRRKEYGKAVYVLRDAVRSFPAETKDLSLGEALYNLGYSLRMSGKPAEAIPVLKKAMSFPFIRNKAARELQSAADQLKKPQPVQWVKP